MPDELICSAVNDDGEICRGKLDPVSHDNGYWCPICGEKYKKDVSGRLVVNSMENSYLLVEISY